MMRQIDSLSVFFPAFNEEENIEKTVKKTLEVMKNLQLKKYEIIVVNDGSSDKTADRVAEIASKDNHVRLVNHDKNRGYGGALKTGFEEAKYDWVAFADSDGQFDFNEIKQFLDKTDRTDLILGFRINRADSYIRKVTTFGWKIIARLLMGLNVKDYSCGFKLIKKEVYKAVLPLKGEEKVTQIEMLVKAKRLGFRFIEVGVRHYPRRFGKQTGANIKVVARSIIDLLKLWWKIR